MDELHLMHPNLGPGEKVSVGRMVKVQMAEDYHLHVQRGESQGFHTGEKALPLPMAQGVVEDKAFPHD
jgi:hypothetical protein